MTGPSDWLEWQREHTDALQALQEAQRMYHRVVSGSAFAGEAGASWDAQKASLQTIDAARVRLDEVRGRQPRVEDDGEAVP